MFGPKYRVAPVLTMLGMVTIHTYTGRWRDAHKPTLLKTGLWVRKIGDGKADPVEWEEFTTHLRTHRLGLRYVRFSDGYDVSVIVSAANADS